MSVQDTDTITGYRISWGMENHTLTALDGVRVGHASYHDQLTGCTLIMFDQNYPMAYRAYGGSPGTFNTDSIRVGMSDLGKRGIFIAGGSLTGLMSAQPIMQAMIDDGIGDFDEGIVNPPIVGAVVYDLGVKLGQYPTQAGYEAYANLSDAPVYGGGVGAGTGTSVGKFQYLGDGELNAGMKAGVGSARIDVGGGVTVCALSVVNALGNVINADGQVLAGNRDGAGGFITFDQTSRMTTESRANTTISVVGINVQLDHSDYDRIAHLATHGHVRAINPVHTSLDGDTVFVFSTEALTEPLNEVGEAFQDDWGFFVVDVLGQAAARAVEMSVRDACVRSVTVPYAQGFEGIIPSVHTYGPTRAIPARTSARD